MISFYRQFLLCLILKVNSKMLDECKSPEIDDILWAKTDGQFYIFRDEYFWHYDFQKKRLGEPRLIHDYWLDVHLPIEAVTDYTESGVNYIIFFSNQEYWKYKSSDELHPKVNFSVKGSYVAAHLRQIEAIQLYEGIDHNAIVCNEEYVHGCDAVFEEDTIVFESCVAYIIYNKFIRGERCKALARYESTRPGSYFVAGEQIFVRGNATQVIKQGNIKYDIFLCKTYFQTHRIQFAVVVGGIIVLFVFNAILMACTIYRKHRQRKESLEKVETTHSDALVRRHTATPSPTAHAEETQQ